MRDPVRRPIGLNPSRIGETLDHSPSANAMTVRLPAMDAQARSSWNGVRSVSGARRVATARIAWRTAVKVVTPR